MTENNINNESNYDEIHDDIMKQILINAIKEGKHDPDHFIECLKKITEDDEYSALIKKEIEKRMKKADDLSGSIKKFLDLRNWPYTLLDEKEWVFLLAIKAEEFVIEVQVVIDDERESVIFRLPVVQCESAYRLVMSDYLTMINSSIIFGAFKIDGSGEVYFEHVVLYKNISFDDESFDIYLSACISSVSRYYKGIKKISLGKFVDSEKSIIFEKIRELAKELSK